MSMATNFEVRLLLVLWDLGGAAVRKGDLNGRFSGKTQEANEACAELIKVGAIESSGGKLFTLTDTGKTLLTSALADDEFEFEAQIGKKMANALLKWLRSNPVTSAEPVAKAAGSTIGSYEAFKVVALETYDQLNRDYNFDNLVPIYRIRRAIGEQVTRSQFSDWLLEMQSNDVFLLQDGTIEDGAPDKLRDSVSTPISGLRCFAVKKAK